MQLALIGLGKMGTGLALNLLEHGHQVIAYNRSPQAVAHVAQSGATPATSPADAIAQLTSSPKIVWLMLPAGDVTEDHIFGQQHGVLQHLQAGDILIDGANSHYKDTIRRNQQITSTGIHYVDVGVSGGPKGARHGACMMVGCDNPTIVPQHLASLFDDLNVPQGWGYFGSSGAGQFVKMVHNGIEYGMMQAIAEGFAIMKASPYDLDFDKLTDVYNHGSVIESRLIGWLQSGFREYGQELQDISGTVGHLGEGQWTAQTAQELGVPAPIIQGSFDFRMQSRDNPSYTAKIVATLRNQFGGHCVKKDDWKKSSL